LTNQAPSNCGVCGSNMQIGGPIWSDKIHNIDFVNRLLAKIKALKESKTTEYRTKGRLEGLLGGIVDEARLADNNPLSYEFPSV
jgi:tRNA G26 N,N-dimethylase Trm1